MSDWHSAAVAYRRLICDTTPWRIHDIAENLGMHHMTVRSLRRDKKLVKEDETVGGKPVWRAGTVRKWAIDTGRMTSRGQPVKLKPWGTPESQQRKGK